MLIVDENLSDIISVEPGLVITRSRIYVSVTAMRIEFQSATRVMPSEWTEVI